jgi:Tfp pilus assembly protein PilP
MEIGSVGFSLRGKVLHALRIEETLAALGDVSRIRNWVRRTRARASEALADLAALAPWQAEAYAT